MEGKPNDETVAERQAEKGQTSGPGKKKVNWKSLLGAAIALAIVWQIFHVVTQGSGKQPGAAGHSSPASSAVPAPRPTPVPTVTLGGRRVSAGGGPVIVLNPGMVGPGGQVGIEGSGFSPRSAVVVWLKAMHSRTGTAVAHSKASVNGSLTAHFTMPSSLIGNSVTVLAQQPSDGKTASAQLAAPGGVGTVTINSKTAAGKPGDHVTVSAKGFGPGEKVNVFWGRVSGIPATTLTADGSGSISSASVPVGVAPVGTTTLVLIGARTRTTATAAYQMLGLYPNTLAHPYAVKAGKPIRFAGSGFAPSEQVLIYLNASTGLPALTATADSGGHFAINFVVPFGLRGSQRLDAIGELSRASVSSGFDVLPYNPSAQASTYGALPGTTVSFYASGFAANEVVMVYAGGGRGSGGRLVSAFRVDGLGSAAAAGHYVVPSGVGPGLYFKLVGQESGGAATAKISVTAPAQQVTIPPQPQYVLPPSLGGKPSPAAKAPSKSPGSSSTSPSARPGATGP